MSLCDCMATVISDQAGEHGVTGHYWQCWQSCSVTGKPRTAMPADQAGVTTGLSVANTPFTPPLE